MDPLGHQQPTHRNRRPDDEHDEGWAGRTIVGPRTPTEESLCKLWAALAPADEVGIHDDFFHLGGDSIAAMHLMARIRKAFSAEVPFGLFVEKPTVAATAAWLETAVRGVSADDAIPPVPPGESRPLSFVQERIWATERLHDGPPLFNVPACLRLRGRLDVAALEAALNETVRRHDVLRSRFPMSDGIVTLAIDPDRRIALEPIALPDVAPDTIEREVDRRAVEFVATPFDLANGPLFRASLLRAGDQDHRLLLVFHHSVFDGLSTTILFRELVTLYRAFTDGLPSPLPGVRIQYQDFARWQRSRWTGEARAQLSAYWADHLAGALPALALPSVVGRPVAQSLRCGRVSALVPGPVATALKALGRREGATLFMVLLAAYQTLLTRYSGQEDLLVGTPIDGRTHVDTERLIGCFVNTLVLRTDVSGNPTFLELLQRVRTVALNAYAHGGMPFGQLVETIRPPRDTGRSPLFQTVLQLRASSAWSDDCAGVELQEFDVFPGVGRLDLALSVADGPDGLACAWDYSRDLFDEGAVGRMSEHFRTLLESAVENPARRILELDLLPSSERRLVLHDWNATARAYPRDTCVHRLVERIAETAPERVALEQADRRVTFGELNRLADQLGRRLSSAQPAAPGAVVGVCLDRTPDVVVAILAVLKAGAAFLPLNPDVPPERLAFMIRDAGATEILTTADLCARFDGAGIPVVRLDSDAGAIARDGARTTRRRRATRDARPTSSTRPARPAAPKGC